MSAPARVGPYEVVRELGRGGMGVVFEVRHPDLGGPFALKLMFGVTGSIGEAASGEGLARFTREAQLMARVRHPGVVKVHTLDRAPEGAYLVSELVPGEALSSICKRGALDPREAARLVRELADAVAALHTAGIVHRDLKPHNVIVKPDGAPVLLDFGIARDLESREQLTRTGAVMGTPAYMAPEQADGTRPSELDGRVDVYALGAILFEALGGVPPFHETASPTSLLKRIMFDEPRWPSTQRPGVPPELEAVLKVAMRKERGARYPSAAALRNDLEAWLRGGRPWAASVAPRSPMRWIVPLALLLTGAVAAVVLFALRPAPPASPPVVTSGRVAAVVTARPPSRTTEPPPRAVPRHAPLLLQSRLDAHHLRAGVAVIDTAAGGDGRDVFAFQTTTSSTELVRFRLDPASDPAAELGDGTPVPLPPRHDVRAAVTLPGRKLLVALQEQTPEKAPEIFRLAVLDDAGPWRPYARELAWPQILVMARSPDGSRVAIGGAEQVWLLEAGTGKLLAKDLAGPEGLYRNVLELAFSPDGRRLASANSVGDGALKSEGQLRVWSTAGGGLDVEFDSGAEELVSGALAVTFAPDGSLFVGLTSGRIDRYLPDGRKRSPTFKHLTAARHHDEIAQGGLVDTSGYAHASDIWGLVVLEDGSLVSVSGGSNKADPADERWNELRRWRITGDVAQELPLWPSVGRSHAGSRPYAGVALSSAGFLLASTWNGGVEVWPLER